jgi:hypothetical protein
MKSRRRIAFPKAGTPPIRTRLQQGFAGGRVVPGGGGSTKWGSGVKLHGSNREALMSAMGQKQTSGKVRMMSALPPIADIAERDRHVRFVPKADSCTAAKCHPIQ